MKKLFLLLLISTQSFAGFGWYYGYGQSQSQALEDALERVKEDDCTVNDVSYQSEPFGRWKVTIEVSGCKADPDDWG